jgi:hypothetical protein
LIHSKIFRYPQCKKMLVSIYQATNQDRWCKHLMVISKFSTMSAQINFTTKEKSMPYKPYIAEY